MNLLLQVGSTFLKKYHLLSRYRQTWLSTILFSLSFLNYHVLLRKIMSPESSRKHCLLLCHLEFKISLLLDWLSLKARKLFKLLVGRRCDGSYIKSICAKVHAIDWNLNLTYQFHFPCWYQLYMQYMSVLKYKMSQYILKSSFEMLSTCIPTNNGSRR